MSRDNQAMLMTFVAVLLLRLGLTDEYLRYVKPAMRPWLLVAGCVLAVLAVNRFVGAGTGAATVDDDHGHEHGGSNLAWLLAVPFAVIFVVGPGPLGAFAAERQAPRVPPPPSTSSEFRYPPLPESTGGAVELSLGEFVARSLYDASGSLEGQAVRLIGFVTPTPSGGADFRLTRFVLSCCAADGFPISVDVSGAPGGSPAPDTWVEVEAAWDPASAGDEVPRVTARQVREVEQPSNPYEV